MRRFYTLFFCSLFIGSTIAQENQDPASASTNGPNLVANPGFEKLRRALPQYDLDGSIAFRNSLDKWMSPSKTTPDLVYQVNAEGADSPHSGKSMVGILSHNPVSKRSDTYREYIQIKLDKKLREGKEYELTFWVMRSAKARIASNNIGAALLVAPVLNADYNPLLKIKPIVNEEKVINPDRPEWVKITKTFTATSNFQFLMIGNFFGNKQTTFKEFTLDDEQAFNNAYYYIDDVSLCELNFVEPVIEVEPKEETLVDAKMEVGAVIRLNNIFFETAKWDLLPASYTELSQLLALMNKYENMKIAIHGHTDSRGGIRYNQSLSENRARSVYEYLLDNRIDPERISSAGFGENNPVDTNDTVDGRQMNRRVEFVVKEM